MIFERWYGSVSLGEMNIERIEQPKKRFHLLLEFFDRTYEIHQRFQYERGKYLLQVSDGKRVNTKLSVY